MAASLYLLILPAALSIPATIMSEKGTKGAEYLKCFVTLLLFAIVVQHKMASEQASLAIPFAAALFSAAVADFLLGSRKREWFFIAGLGLFLIAYAIYGITIHLIAGLHWFTLPITIIIAGIAILQGKTMRKLPKDMKIPVYVYIFVLSHLLSAAIIYAITTFSSQPLTAGLIFFGALLIYLSDSFIAHNLYRKEMKHSESWILASYYPGQIAIVAAVLLLG